MDVVTALVLRLHAFHDERVRFRQRWIGSLAGLKAAGVAVNVVWARRDPIAVPAIL